MTVPTNVRAGRVTALLAGFQSARGTPVSDFTAGTAKRIWTREADVDSPLEFMAETFMDSGGGVGLSAYHAPPEKPAGALQVIATPTALEMLLKSNFGAYSAPNFTLASQVSDTRWLTLAWVEKIGGTTERFIRIRDCWVHRLDLGIAGPQGRLEASAEYAGRKVLVQTLNGGGITLPASPMQPSDKSPFPAAYTFLTRDPAGAAVELRWKGIRMTFDQGLAHPWDMAAGLHDVYKAGKLTAELEFTSEWSDETWAIHDLNLARTYQTYRVESAAENGRTLTVDFRNVAFRIDPPGHGGKLYKPFRAVGRASVSGSNFVSVSLT